jgi:hypothetical protein
VCLTRRTGMAKLFTSASSGNEASSEWSSHFSEEAFKTKPNATTVRPSGLPSRSISLNVFSSGKRPFQTTADLNTSLYPKSTHNV